MRAEWARKKSQNRDTVNMVMQGLRQRGYAPDRKHFLPNETHPQVFRQVQHFTFLNRFLFLCLIFKLSLISGVVELSR